jgi:hypothetical protein
MLVQTGSAHLLFRSIVMLKPDMTMPYQKGVVFGRNSPVLFDTLKSDVHVIIIIVSYNMIHWWVSPSPFTMYSHLVFKMCCIAYIVYGSQDLVLVGLVWLCLVGSKHRHNRSSNRDAWLAPHQNQILKIVIQYRFLTLPRAIISAWRSQVRVKCGVRTPNYVVVGVKPKWLYTRCTQDRFPGNT